jgi:hypothetical protein
MCHIEKSNIKIISLGNLGAEWMRPPDQSTLGEFN